jgi:hypothetical protein
LYDAKFLRDIVRVESEFATRQQKEIIDQQQKTITAKDEVIERNAIIGILVLLVALLFASLSFTLYRFYRQNKSVNKLLEDKVRIRTAAFERAHHELKQELEAENLLVNKKLIDLQQCLTDTDKDEYLREITNATKRNTLKDDSGVAD